jgi:hypothetical protein
VGYEEDAFLFAVPPGLWVNIAVIEVTKVDALAAFRGDAFETVPLFGEVVSKRELRPMDRDLAAASAAITFHFSNED